MNPKSNCIGGQPKFFFALNFQMAIGCSKMIQIEHMRCFSISTFSIDVTKTSHILNFNHF